MKKSKILISFLAIFMIINACQKETHILEDQHDINAEQLEWRAKKHPVPFHAEYLSEWLVFPPQPDPAVCGTGAPVVNLRSSGSGHATHMGNIAASTSSCIDPTTTPPTIFNGEVTLTAANGDELYIFQTIGTQNQLEIFGGTGRFEDATGSVTGRFEVIAPGVVMNYLDGEIQY